MKVIANRKWTRITSVVGVLGAALAITACGSSTSSNAGSQPASGYRPAAGNGTAAALSITTAKGSNGTYLVGPDGRALYLWDADSSGKSACSGACAQAWPPLTAKGKPSVSGGASAVQLGTTIRSGGARQVTYMGHPLYYYAGDSSKGQVNGQGSNQFGAKWWLVAPSGSAITTSGPSASASGSSSIGY